MMKLIFILSFLFITQSCANYMQGIYDDLNRANLQNRLSQAPQYRRHKKMKNSRFGDINSGNAKIVRRYQNTRSKKRVTSEDLIDNAPSLSLWAGGHKGQNLFTEDIRKRNGDIVLINVESSLKDEISRELKRAFPPLIRPVKKAKKDAEEEAPNPAAEGANATAAPSTNQDTDKVESTIYDRISSVIIEEVNEKYLLLRGRKTVLFRQRKRMIELQALVARRDVSIEDTISSSKLLEATINIVK